MATWGLPVCHALTSALAYGAGTFERGSVIAVGLFEQTPIAALMGLGDRLEAQVHIASSRSRTVAGIVT